ncbi:MAG: hypothetical protein K6E50_08525 [Lachnospiraceae bacterium]|nr:hypothetical protein [Lachnospiraceae bacterium]
MKNNLKTIVIMVLLVGGLVGFYLYLSSRNARETSSENEGNEQVREMTAVQKLIAEADYKEYPATPVQLLKYYNQITACFYNEEYSEEELMSLGEISRRLMDRELVANQNDAEFFSQLKMDIANLKSQGDYGTTIYQIDVTPSMDVEYYEHEGYECARLYDTFTLKQMVNGTIYYPVVRYVYIMRKDDEGHWKIFGFKKEEDGQGEGSLLMN